MKRRFVFEWQQARPSVKELTVQAENVLLWVFLIHKKYWDNILKYATTAFFHILPNSPLITVWCTTPYNI
jgi:hypothetical protein